MFFVLLVLKNFFINSTKHVFFFFENKNRFPKFNSQTLFFLNTNFFLIIVFKNNNQTDSNPFFYLFVFFTKISLFFCYKNNIFLTYV